MLVYIRRIGSIVDVCVVSVIYATLSGMFDGIWWLVSLCVAIRVDLTFSFAMVGMVPTVFSSWGVYLGLGPLSAGMMTFQCLMAAICGRCAS